MTAAVPPPAWTEQALCAQVDPELWFPDKGRSAPEARAVCQSCPVREACLDYGLTNHEEFGIWGGHTPREMQGMRRDRGIAPRPAGGAPRKDVCVNGHERTPDNMGSGRSCKTCRREQWHKRRAA